MSDVINLISFLCLYCRQGCSQEFGYKKAQPRQNRGHAHTSPYSEQIGVIGVATVATVVTIHKKSFLQAPCKSSQCIIHNTDLFVNCFECHKQTALCIINAVNPSFLIMLMLRYNTWVTNKKQEKVLLWYNLIGQTTIERRTNSCARIIPQKLTIVNVCLSME